MSLFGNCSRAVGPGLGETGGSGGRVAAATACIGLGRSADGCAGKVAAVVTSAAAGRSCDGFDRPGNVWADRAVVVISTTAPMQKSRSTFVPLVMRPASYYILASPVKLLPSPGQSLYPPGRKWQLHTKRFSSASVDERARSRIIC